jgi:probable O-glycosylation ligase (exosortase A-associated)
MRDALLFLIVACILPFIPKRPAVGAMAFTWISLMNPHRLTYGAAFEFPWAALLGGLTLVCLLAHAKETKLPRTGLVVTLVLFMAWMTITTPFAFEQDLAWAEWNRVMKTLFFSLVTMAALNSVKDTKQFMLVVTLSLAFYGLKGGIFTLLSGGSSRVIGPPDTYIGDNNDLALALLTITPLIWYLHLQARRPMLRWSLAVLALLNMVAVVGSYSRGALLGSGAMLVFLWLKSRNKVRTGVIVLLLVPLVLTMMPQQWFARMDSIGEYQADGSAMGRVNAWHFAMNVATQNPLGGGFKTFTPRMFQLYAPNPTDVHAPHSLYFQVLGEHGFVGLLLFVTFLILAWRTGSRVQRFCKGKSELQWATDLASMCQVSLIGYCTGGAFLTLAYADLLYDVVIILVLLEKVLILQSAQPVRTTVPLAAPKPRAAESEPA